MGEFYGEVAQQAQNLPTWGFFTLSWALYGHWPNPNPHPIQKWPEILIKFIQESVNQTTYLSFPDAETLNGGTLWEENTIVTGHWQLVPWDPWPSKGKASCYVTEVSLGI